MLRCSADCVDKAIKSLLAVVVKGHWAKMRGQRALAAGLAAGFPFNQDRNIVCPRENGFIRKMRIAHGHLDPRITAKLADHWQALSFADGH